MSTRSVELEVAIESAESELQKLRAVRELLEEMRATVAPPQYQLRYSQEAEHELERAQESLRRRALAEAEATHDRLSHYVAEAQGYLDMLESFDAFDARRERRHFRSKYAESGLVAMQAVRTSSTTRNITQRVQFVEAMQSFVETTLPQLERTAREKVEASVTLTLRLPRDQLDENMLAAIVQDAEECIGLAQPRCRHSGVAPTAGREGWSDVVIQVLDGSGKGTDEICAEIADAADRGNLFTCPNEVRRGLVYQLAHSVLEVSAATVTAGHYIVHDGRTLAQRSVDARTAYELARKSLSSRIAKDQIATAAQAQLWKVEGLEAAMAHCRNPELVAAKALMKERRPRLAQLAKDAQDHSSPFEEAERTTLELQAHSEVYRRLIAATAIARIEERRGRRASLVAYLFKKEERGYSTAALRDVSQQLLKEKRALDMRLGLQSSKLCATHLEVQAAKRDKFTAQGALQLLKDFHANTMSRLGPTVPRELPSIRMRAFAQVIAQSESMQRDAMPTIARAAVALSFESVGLKASAEQETNWSMLKAIIQMQPRKCFTDSSAIDEIDVERAAADLGVNLRDASHLHLLPLVLFYTRAPLPSSWFELSHRQRNDRVHHSEHTGLRTPVRMRSLRRMSMSQPPPVLPEPPPSRVSEPLRRSSAGSQASGLGRVIFVHDMTGEQSMVHPLRNIFRSLAEVQLRRTRNATRRSDDTAAPDAWAEFVEPSGAVYYYCFLTGERSYEFPSLVPPTYLGMPIKSTAHTHGRRLQARMASRATQRRLSPASLEAMRLAMEAEQRSKPRRSALLAKGPLPAPLIVATAQYLDIDPLAQTRSMWIASACLTDILAPTLPVGWEKVKTVKHRHGHPKGVARSYLPVYYFNPMLGCSQWEHPALTYWRSVLLELNALQRRHVSEANRNATREADAALLHRDPTLLWVDAEDQERTTGGQR